MSRREIVLFGDPRLRKESVRVANFGPELTQLLDEMTEILYAEEGRAGLAAPQVGVLERVIVVGCGEGLIELVNPVIVVRHGEQVRQEACLSYPGYSGFVRRASYVKVRSFDRAGKEFEIEGVGFLAQCLQHEIDHLDGILYIDHVGEGNLYDTLTGKRVDVHEAIHVSRP